MTRRLISRSMGSDGNRSGLFARERSRFVVNDDACRPPRSLASSTVRRLAAALVLVIGCSEPADAPDAPAGGPRSGTFAASASDTASQPSTTATHIPKASPGRSSTRSWQRTANRTRTLARRSRAGPRPRGSCARGQSRRAFPIRRSPSSRRSLSAPGCAKRSWTPRSKSSSP